MGVKTIPKGGWQRNVERVCPICGTEYIASSEYLKCGKQTTCSRKCSYRLRGNEKKAGIEIVCNFCRKKFTRVPSQFKAKHGAEFCSRRCHFAGRSAGLSKRVVSEPYKYTHGGLTKLRKAAAHLYASGKGVSFPETELAVVAALTEAGVSFVHQHVVEFDDTAYVLDFLFDGRFVVELDTREHRKPARREADAKRDRRLAAAGFVIRRVHDSGVPEDAIRAVLDALLERAKH